MPRVTFANPNGTRQTIEVPDGETLMRAAVHGGVDGILGECGGACCCATCHVYLDDTSMARVPPPGAMESHALEFTAATRRAGSRLACQLIAGPGCDGLLVELPAIQV